MAFYSETLTFKFEPVKYTCKSISLSLCIYTPILCSLFCSYDTGRVAWRCIDFWFQEVFKELRNGSPSEGNYIYLNGNSTQRTGTWSRGTERASRCNVKCDEVNAQSGRNGLYSARVVGQIWGEMWKLEYLPCAVERLRGCRVAHSPGDQRFHVAPFDSAPYAHPSNELGYQAVLDRARGFARVQGRMGPGSGQVRLAQPLGQRPAAREGNPFLAKARHRYQGHPWSLAIGGGFARSWPRAWMER